MTRTLRPICATLLCFAAATAFAQTPIFAPRIDIGNTPGAVCSAIADVNGDGRPDILVGAGNSVYLLLQNAGAPGTFSNQGAVLNAGAGILGIATGDFNGDNKQDVAIVTGAGGGLLVSLGNGNRTFQALNSIATGNYMSVVVLDFNNDHKQDIAAVTSNGINSIFLGDGLGGFSLSATLVQGSTAPLSIADLNGDNRPDLVASPSVYLNNGNGTAGALRSGNVFDPNVRLDFFGSFTAAADFDNDGKQDIVTINLGGSGVLNLGTGAGAFQADIPLGIPLISNNFALGLAAADFNSDGRQDLVRFEAGNPAAVNIFPGTGGGLFQSSPISLKGCSASFQVTSSALTVGDLNGDGIPDIIASCNDGNMVSVFLSLAPSVFLQSSANPSTPGQTVKLTAVVGSPSIGFLFANGFSVQFYDGGVPLGGPVTALGGQATRTTNTLAQGIHYITAALLNSQGAPIATSGVVSQVVSPSTCASNVTGQLTITPGGFRRNPVTGQYTQTVNVLNSSGLPISGPLSLALTRLSSGVTALNTDGFTTCSVTPNVAVVDLGVCSGGTLAPGASLSATLTFSNPNNTAIAYTPVALAGFAPR
jgi:hypothetical protein